MANTTAKGVVYELTNDTADFKVYAKYVSKPVNVEVKIDEGTLFLVWEKRVSKSMKQYCDY